MCGTCGCSGENGGVKVIDPKHHTHHHHHHGHDHHDHHDHDHSHHHHHHHHSHDHHKTDGHDTQEAKTVLDLEHDILQQNQLDAARNRGYFDAKKILALNLVSSPGSGKTSLLECTLRDLKAQFPFFVIEGDQQTLNDAKRIEALDIPVIQINTGSGCHLESDMVYDAIQKLDLKDNSILMIENVGNLVCPSLFDLGERNRIVIISTTEGEDKPLKYPNMFHTSDVCVINKMDLAPYLDIDLELLKNNALKVNPKLVFFEVSCKTGEGLSEWYTWLTNQMT